MAGSTKIEWADVSWNVIIGCSRVSEGCRNCYAERFAARQMSGRYAGLVTIHVSKPDGTTLVREPRWTGEVRLVESVLDAPLRWRQPRRIFVNSMGDLFHEKVPDEWIDRVFAVMGAAARRHTFQVLTKRPERMLAYFNAKADTRVYPAISALYETWRRDTGREFLDSHLLGAYFRAEWPLPNVWLGVSVEDRSNLARLEMLREVPAALRFVSFEPLLEDLGKINLAGIGWAIIGGESGPGARRFNVALARRTVEQCRAAVVPCFMKQMGAFVVDRNDVGFTGWDDGEGWPDGTEIEEDIDGYREDYQGAPVRVKLRDRKGADPSEWPSDLRVRDFPDVAPWLARRRR